MNNNVTIFKSPQFGEIRTAGDAENPMFCLADLCKVLELQVQNTKNRLKDDGVYRINLTDSLGREQQALFVNEQNLYRVIMRSDKPQAEAFQDWVCGEVLPSIRKTGGYIATAPDDTPEIIMAKAIKIADMKIKQQSTMIELQSQQIEEQKAELQIEKPLADYTREVLQSNSTYTLTQVSKDLNFRSIYAFEKWAMDNKILYYQSKQWIPTAKYSECGYFATRTAKYVKSDGTVGSSISTVVTEKGRQFLHDFIKQQSQHKRVSNL